MIYSNIGLLNFADEGGNDAMKGTDGKPKQNNESISHAIVGAVLLVPILIVKYMQLSATFRAQAYTCLPFLESA